MTYYIPPESCLVKKLLTFNYWPQQEENARSSGEEASVEKPRCHACLTPLDKTIMNNQSNNH